MGLEGGKEEERRKTIRGHNGGGRRSVRPSVCLSVSGDNMELSRREASQCLCPDFNIIKLGVVSSVDLIQLVK